MTPTDYAKFFKITEMPEYFARIESRMIELVSAADPIIRDPMLRLIKGINGRFAMVLVLPVVRSQGKPVDDSVIKCCAALELWSLAFCIHDDVVDNANIRYGVPSINAEEGVGHAILIGDFVINMVIKEVLSVSPEIANVVLDSIAENRVADLTEAAGKYKIDRKIDSYLKCVKMKTASHFMAFCKVGALCAGLTKTKVQAFADYGEAFGMTQQLLDDLLDFTSTEEIMGKPVGHDVEEGIYNLPLLLAMNGPNKAQIKKLIKSIPNDKNATDELLDIIISTGSIGKTIDEIRIHTELAAKCLNFLENNEILMGLKQFPALYLDLLLSNMAVKLRRQPRII